MRRERCNISNNMREMNNQNNTLTARTYREATNDRTQYIAVSGDTRSYKVVLYTSFVVSVIALRLNEYAFTQTTAEWTSQYTSRQHLESATYSC